MGDWPGVRGDISSVGSGLATSQNTRYRYGGELRQRVGLTRCTAPDCGNPVTRIFAAQDYVYFCDGTDIRSIAVGSLEVGDPGSDAGESYAVARPTPVTIQDVVYLYGGASATKVLVSAGSLSDIGLAAPADLSDFTSVNSPGEVNTGFKLYRGRARGTRGHLGILSNPTAINSIEITTEDWSLRSGMADFATTYPIIELTPSDGATFYRTVVTDDWDVLASNLAYYRKSDAILQQSTPAAFYNEYGHEQPYDCDKAAWVRSYMFIAGYASAPNRVYWSTAGYPESFYKTVQFRDFLDNGDEIQGLVGHLGDLWVLGRASADRYVWSSDPLNGERVVIPGSLGVWNQRCIARSDRALLGWGPNGVWVLEGGRQVHISRPIDDVFQDNQDTDYVDQFHMAYNPDERIVQCFYVASGDTVTKSAAVFFIDKGVWCTAEYDLGITSSATVMTADRPRTLLGDEHGRVWFQQGSNDGMDSTADSVQTVAAGATTTTLTLSAPAECEGAMLYYPAEDELRRISGYSAGVVTLASALSSAPPDGALVAVGGINFKLETNWWMDESLSVKKLPIGLYIEYVPQTVGTLDVTIYHNFSSTAETLALVDDDTLPYGVSRTATGLQIDLSGSGFVKVPMVTDNSRAIKAVVESNRLASSPQILKMYFQPEPHGNRRGDKE